MIFEKSFFSKNIFLLQKVDANASQLFDFFLFLGITPQVRRNLEANAAHWKKKFTQNLFLQKYEGRSSFFLNQAVKLLIYEPNASLIFLSVIDLLIDSSLFARSIILIRTGVY